MAKRKKIDSEINPTDDMPGASPEMAGDTTAAGMDRERIAMRAYELYLARGASDGQADDDWLSAERELMNASGGSDADRES